MLVGVVQKSMKEENIKRMKVLDDETIVRDAQSGAILSRDIVHYVGTSSTEKYS